MNAEIENAIICYCQQRKLTMTSDFLTAQKEPIARHTDQNLENIFEGYFKTKNEKPGLSFSFKSTSDIAIQRKRLLNKEIELKQNKGVKKKITETDEIKIPKEFLLLLDELGLDKKDARKFYENKDQWTYVKSDRKIFCTVKGCDYSTVMGIDCLSDHCVTVHGWGRFPCTYDYCKYEAYSQKCFKECFIKY